MQLSAPFDDAVIDSLIASRWCTIEGFLDPATTRSLAASCRGFADADGLQLAGVARESRHGPSRGDHTRWLGDTGLSTGEHAYLLRLNALRRFLSRGLMVRMADVEAHYALYEPGAGYSRHLDCPGDDFSRIVSTVFYLNENWLDADGGALRLYFDGEAPRDIMPVAGTLVLFLSRYIEHEVMTATVPRMSIASWMRHGSTPKLRN
ncbi:SM-20-related protein [Luteibacter rhizovicinus]|uniref:SM-20-related protein n=1 Tax=Luteibacter rhizovicinus TaxID=242606 RepID=A0A4R3YG68_9GAMM|nr:2OG-Fe(II) oxygenase [Luteibacter rhizovicinus]TCV91156.1 SM-20-related protein [Luteibacter rhizovicinus]